MNKISVQYYKSPVGEIIIGTIKDQLCLCDWRYRKMRSIIDMRVQKELNAEFEECASHTGNTTITQLEEYFNGERREFTIPLKLIGTPFQGSVWQKLMEIPFGKTETYTSLSQKLNNIKAIRAVASANGANAIAVIVPCHRVIGSNGELIGYAGGLQVKKKLLQLEKSAVEQLELF